ncbi:MAG: hypothetical protein ACRC2J_15540, partial [Microcoleaceae cyanobacterium]
LFSQRFIQDEKEPALAIRKMIEGLQPISPNRQVKLHSITTMGSPILLLNTMLGIKTEIINNFAESYTEKPLRWLNVIHASDLVAYPLTSSFGDNISPNLLLRDEFIVEDANWWESMARTIGQSGMAMASGAGEAHVKYWDHQQCLQLLAENITAKSNVSNTAEQNTNSDLNIDTMSETNINNDDVNNNTAEQNTNSDLNGDTMSGANTDNDLGSVTQPKTRVKTRIKKFKTLLNKSSNKNQS